MAKIVDLKRYRSQVLEARGFGPWKQRFGETYGEKTTLADVTGQTIMTLAQPGDESTAAYYELIMGVLDLGPATKFHYLPNDERMLVVDTHLFLADQVRFEMMRRLGWLSEIPYHNHTLMEMVQSLDKVKSYADTHPPRLSESHEGYDGYIGLHHREKESFIRRLLPAALEVFKKRIETPPL